MQDLPLDGGCACGAVRYRLLRQPMFVHCCHCNWCQRESGSAFAVNAIIESSEVQLLTGSPEKIDTPSASGRWQIYRRCPSCRIALWSHYSSAREAVSFVRAGTLDDPATCPPDIHIFTSSKQAWFELPAGAAAVEEYYQRSAYWPVESVARYAQATDCS